MKFSDDGCRFLEQREGKKNEVYKDTAGLPTIGIGHLVKKGEVFGVLTDEEIYDLLRKDLTVYVRNVNRNVIGLVNQNQFDALVSLCFNIGCGNFNNSSVLKYLNEDNLHRAADAFLLFNKVRNPKTKKLEFSQGLENRRQLERKMFMRE